MSDVGCRMSDVGCRMSDVGCRMSDVGSRMSDVGSWMSDVGSRMAPISFRMNLFDVDIKGTRMNAELCPYYRVKDYEFWSPTEQVNCCQLIEVSTWSCLKGKVQLYNTPVLQKFLMELLIVRVQHRLLQSRIPPLFFIPSRHPATMSIFIPIPPG